MLFWAEPNWSSAVCHAGLLMCYYHGRRNLKIEIHPSLYLFPVYPSIRSSIPSLIHFDLLGLSLWWCVCVGFAWRLTCSHVNTCWLVAGNILVHVVISSSTCYLYLIFHWLYPCWLYCGCLAVPAPRRLRFKVLGSNKLHVSWKEPKGDFDSYRFLYNTIPGKMSDVPYRHMHTHMRTQRVLDVNAKVKYSSYFETSGGRIPLWFGLCVCQEGLCNLFLIKAPLKGLHSWEMWKFVQHLCQVWDKEVFFQGTFGSSAGLKGGFW